MPPRKAAAQAGHAYVGALTAALAGEISPDVRRYLAEAPGTKVALGASLFEIERVRDRLEAARIPFFLVTDSGHVLPPDFDGRPIVTALGVGPLRLSGC